jgi:hypothetical protein
MAPKSAQIWGWGVAGTSVKVHLDSEQVSTTVQGKKFSSKCKN